MQNDLLLERAKALKLYGLISHWPDICHATWIKDIIDWEESARVNRSLERRLKSACIGRFKPLAQFDWDWPKKCDREAIEELMQLEFISNATNIILCGPNGAGKSTIAKNIAYTAAMRGHTALFTSAADMLSELASQDGDAALRRRVKFYAQPTVLIVDEIGYLSYSNRHADLLFEIISKRHHNKSTIVTTNKAFGEWNQIFPNAACVVSMVDRLVHHSEIISIDAESYRLKEALELAEKRKKVRAERRTASKTIVQKKEVLPS